SLYPITLRLPRREMPCGSRPHGGGGVLPAAVHFGSAVPGNSPCPPQQRPDLCYSHQRSAHVFVVATPLPNKIPHFRSRAFPHHARRSTANATARTGDQDRRSAGHSPKRSHLS